MTRKLKEVIEADFRNSDIEDDLQYWLLKIEPLKKRTPEGEKVKLEDIEQLIIKLTKKYNIVMQWISLTIIDDNEVPWFSLSIKDGQTHEWLKNVYGITLYELIAKAALFMFAKTREKERGKDG